jgi:metal-responsive CopG/Arc/MetJ family transcriptional regulator
MTEYATVRLPKELMDQIDAFLKQQTLGYTSRAELVKDAVRGFLANASPKSKPNHSLKRAVIPRRTR